MNQPQVPSNVVAGRSSPRAVRNEVAMTEDNAGVVKGLGWRPWYVGCQIVFLLLVCGGPLGYFGLVDLVDRHDWAAAEQYVKGLEQEAERAAPPGSDKETAKAWLASQGLTESEPDLDDSAVEGHGIPAEQLGGILQGTTLQEQHFGILEARICFFLDKQGRVIKHQVYYGRLDG